MAEEGIPWFDFDREETMGGTTDGAEHDAAGLSKQDYWRLVRLRWCGEKEEERGTRRRREVLFTSKAVRRPLGRIHHSQNYPGITYHCLFIHHSSIE